MSRDEMIAAFELDGISGGAAVFDPEKLDWFNTQYLAMLSSDELAGVVKPLLQAAGLWNDTFDGERREWLQRVLRLVLPRAKRLPDLVAQARPFLIESVELDPEAVRKHLSSRRSRRRRGRVDRGVEPLGSRRRTLRRADDRARAPCRGRRARIKAVTLFHAARIAATGTSVSPGNSEVLRRRKAADAVTPARPADANLRDSSS